MVELVEAGADVVLPAVPGTRQDVVLDLPFAERPLEVEAGALHGVELVPDPRQRQLDVARVHAPDRAGADLVGAGDGYLHRASTLAAPGIYASRVATILLCGVDLFFRGKLEAALAGHRLITTDSIDPPDLVIADVSRVDPADVADNYPDVPLLGYTNHTDTAGLRRAHTAGFDHVVIKANLEERAKELVEELTPSVE